MKLLLLSVLLATSSVVQAGELLPMTGKQSKHMRLALDQVLPDAVAALPDDIKVEPHLERIAIDGRAKKLLFGPLAGGGNIVLRIYFYRGSERVGADFVSKSSGAWKGTFRPGTDLALVDQVAREAADLVRGYSSRFTAK